MFLRVALFGGEIKFRELNIVARCDFDIRPFAGDQEDVATERRDELAVVRRGRVTVNRGVGAFKDRAFEDLWGMRFPKIVARNGLFDDVLIRPF